MLSLRDAIMAWRAAYHEATVGVVLPEHDAVRALKMAERHLYRATSASRAWETMR